MTEKEINTLERVLTFIEKYGLLLATWIFSIFTKFYVMYKYRKNLAGKQAIIELIITILGSAIAIYVIYQMDIHPALSALLGSFSGIVISPMANAVSKHTPDILDKIAKKTMDYIDSFKPK